MKYPFVPKSTAYLKEGQIMSIPLSDGSYACGRILQLKVEGEKRDSRMFIAGLMDWHGNEPPCSEAISGTKILAHGQVHVKTVKECGAEIVGYLDLGEDNTQIPLSLDQSPGRNCRLRRGYDLLDPASDSEQSTLHVFSTWGFKVMKNLAEKHYVEQSV
ncbi:MAG: hypothetical protein P1U57_10585 [Oleibacter sp.]|nr:hypothetical protein [Thalassolituus sp.]